MYNAQTVKDRINSLCQLQNITVKKMLVDIGLNPNTVGRIGEEKGMGSFSLARIADYLHTSVDYLLDRTDNPDDYSVELREIQTIMNALSVRERTELMSIIYKFYDEKLSR